MRSRLTSSMILLSLLYSIWGCTQSVTSQAPVEGPTQYIPPTAPATQVLVDVETATEDNPPIAVPTTRVAPTEYMPPSVTPTIYVPPTVTPTKYVPPSVTPMALQTNYVPPTAPPTQHIQYYTYEIDYANTVEINGGGGEGGNELYMSCPTGFAATGLIGRAGTYIDRIGLHCSHLEKNGSASNSLTTESYGGYGGSEFSTVCPANQFLTIVVGRSGGYVDQISGHCESIDGSFTSSTVSVGGNGGSPFTASCPAGYVVTGIHGRAGAWVDRLNFVCSKINKSQY